MVFVSHVTHCPPGGTGGEGEGVGGVGEGLGNDGKGEGIAGEGDGEVANAGTLKP